VQQYLSGCPSHFQPQMRRKLPLISFKVRETT
jgi:hypothetical protein